MALDTVRSERASGVAARIAVNVARVLEGKTEEIELALTCLLARGHLLVEDVPGVGKTTLARALATSIGVTFRRLQCTADLLPSDVTGGNVWDAARSEFSFRPGPVFTSVLLADEINRATPRAQSALLEAMDERRVSIDGETRSLPDPFFVVATQNPEEFHGTYPLPESQLDRFLVRLRLGYPPAAVERAVLGKRRARDPLEELQSVVTREELLAVQSEVDAVKVADPVLDHLHALVLATRNTPLLALGASTRAALALERSVRAHAVVQGRSYALPDDVKRVAVPILAHRVRLAGAAASSGAAADAERVVRDLVDSVSVPV